MHEADVEAAIGRHDPDEDDFTAFLEEHERLKTSHAALKRTVRALQRRLREEARASKKWRRRCLALAGSYRLPRGRGVIQL